MTRGLMRHFMCFMCMGIPFVRTVCLMLQMLNILLMTGLLKGCVRSIHCASVVHPAQLRDWVPLQVGLKNPPTRCDKYSFRFPESQSPQLSIPFLKPPRTQKNLCDLNCAGNSSGYYGLVCKQGDLADFYAITSIPVIALQCASCQDGNAITACMADLMAD